MEDIIKLVEDSLSNKLSKKKGIKGAKQLKRNNNMKKKSIQFYLVARKPVQGSVMSILPKSPGCKYITSTGDYQKQIKYSGYLLVLILQHQNVPIKIQQRKKRESTPGFLSLKKTTKKYKFARKCF